MQRAPNRLLTAADAKKALSIAANSGRSASTRTGLLHTRDDDDDASGRRRVLYVVACCCSLVLCILVAVLVARALSSAESSSTTTTTTTTSAPPTTTEPAGEGTEPPTLPGENAHASHSLLHAQPRTQTSAPLTLTHFCDVPYPGNSTVLSFFSYSSLGNYELPAGPLNRITPGAANQGQTTRFKAGSFTGAARVAWDRAAHASIAWHLRTSTASNVLASTATANSAAIVACPSLLSL